MFVKAKHKLNLAPKTGDTTTCGPCLINEKTKLKAEIVHENIR